MEVLDLHRIITLIVSGVLLWVGRTVYVLDKKVALLESAHGDHDEIKKDVKQLMEQLIRLQTIIDERLPPK